MGLLTFKKMITKTITRYIAPKAKNEFQYQRHERDSGSTEVQIVRQTIRIAELTEHLKRHKHDHATKRGLTMIIGKRLGMLRYLIRKDRTKYLHICTELGLKKLAQ